MNEIGEHFFAGARLAFDQHGSLRVGNAQRQLDGAANRRCLSDDPFFAITFVQGTAQVHDLGGKLIALERGADLIGNAFDQLNLMVLKAIARSAPHQTQQSESLSRHLYWRNQRGPTAQRRVEDQPERNRQIRLQQLQGLSFGEQFHHRRKFGYVQRLLVRINQTSDGISRSVWRCFECRQADAPASGIEYAKRRIVCANQANRPLEHQRTDFAKIRSSIQRVGNFQ